MNAPLAYQTTEWSAAARLRWRNDCRRQSVRSTSNMPGTGARSPARETPSDMPRGGSFTVSHRIRASTIPGRPARMNVFRHPMVWLPQPPSAAPSDVPIGTASA